MWQQKHVFIVILQVFLVSMIARGAYFTLRKGGYLFGGGHWLERGRLIQEIRFVDKHEKMSQQIDVYVDSNSLWRRPYLYSRVSSIKN